MTTTILQLPPEIILIILEYLFIPDLQGAPYEGYYIARDRQRTVDYFIDLELFKERARFYLHDVLEFAATCKDLWQLAGPLVWGDFTLSFRTRSEELDDRIRDSPPPEPLDISLALSPLLACVTVFEPVMHYVSMPLGGTPMDTKLIELINPVTMPRLQRLLLASSIHELKSFSSLGAQLIQYNEGAQYGLRRVNISMFMSTKLRELPRDLFPFIDNILLFYLSSDLSLLKLLQGLKSFSAESTNFNARLPSLARTILNNRLTLKALSIRYLPKEILGQKYVDPKWWSLPHLEDLACCPRNLWLFLQSPEVCQSLKTLRLRLREVDNLGEISFSRQLTGVVRLEVDMIPSGAQPEEYLSFFTRLQLACPELESLTFAKITVSEVHALAPVISKVAWLSLSVQRIPGVPTDWPRNASTFNSLRLESTAMTVNRIVTDVLPSNIRELFIPLNYHELISYPLLKSVALGGTSNNNRLTPTLFVDATWPRANHKLTPAQLHHRNKLLGEAPQFLDNFTMYESVLDKPTGKTQELAYLSDLFLDFNEPFSLTEFCHFICDLNTLAGGVYRLKYDSYEVRGKVKLIKTNYDKAQIVKMQVKIDLPRLRELLSGHA